MIKIEYIARPVLPAPWQAEFSATENGALRGLLTVLPPEEMRQNPLDPISIDKLPHLAPAQVTAACLALDGIRARQASTERPLPVTGVFVRKGNVYLGLGSYHELVDDKRRVIAMLHDMFGTRLHRTVKLQPDRFNVLVGSLLRNDQESRTMIEDTLKGIAPTALGLDKTSCAVRHEGTNQVVLLEDLRALLAEPVVKPLDK